MIEYTDNYGSDTVYPPLPVQSPKSGIKGKTVAEILQGILDSARRQQYQNNVSIPDLEAIINPIIEAFKLIP